MDTKEAVNAAKIVLAISLGYLIYSEMSNRTSIFGNYLWMFIIAIIIVGAMSMFSFLLHGGANY